MKRLVMVLAALAACTDAPIDSPEVAAKKDQCRALEAHMFRISPESAAKFANLDESAAKTLAASMVAAEDIDLCVAAEKAVLSCMLVASDVEDVKSCISPESDAIACILVASDVDGITSCLRDALY